MATIHKGLVELLSKKQIENVATTRLVNKNKTRDVHKTHLHLHTKCI